MPIVKYLLTILFIFVSIQCQCQNSFFLRGEIEGSHNGKVYLEGFQYHRNFRRLFLDSAYIENNKFTFIGNLENSSEEAYLSFNLGKEFKKILLVKGKNELKVTSFNYYISNITDSGDEKRVYNSFKVLDDEFQKQLALGQRNPLLKESLKNDHLDAELALIDKNRDNFYSLIRLNYLIRRTFRTSLYNLSQHFQNLNSDIRNSKAGIELKQHLDHAFSLDIGKKLPEFSFKTVENSNFTNDSLSNNLHLLAFSATWCAPCLEKIPYIDSLKEKYKNYGFDVIYINMDNDRKKWFDLIASKKRAGWINLTDVEKSTVSKMVAQFNIVYFPTYLLVDKNKIIKYNPYLLNDIEHARLEQYIKSEFKL